MCLWNGSQCSSSGSLTYGNPPYIYDRFTENEAGTPLLSLGSPSAELTVALTSSAYFDGANANAANGGSRVPLYTPNPWKPGSSYSHVAQSFDGTVNALMTYSVSPQEMIHDPGPVAKGILRDIGWSLVTLPPPAAPSALTAAAASTSQINLSWSDNSSSETGFEIYRSPDNSSWALVTTAAANATSYANSGLAGGTRYYYRVRAVNASGPSGYSNSADAVTLGPPPAPTGLNALAINSTRIDLTWSDNSNSETGFEIYRSPDNSVWTLVTTTAQNATSYANSGLAGGTRYYYRVRAVNGGGASAYSNSANAVTLGPPPVPTGLSALPFSSTRIDLTWSDNSNSETGFEIHRSPDNSTWTLVTIAAQNAISYSNTGLTGGTRYYYRVRAVSGGGASGYSNSADAVTLGPPPAPSSLTALAAGATRIELAWSDNSNIETGFEIQRSPDGSSGWVTVTTAAANAISYSNTGLSPATPYHYRVRATSTQGTSSDSNPASTTTWAILYQVFMPAAMR
jgi:fibronectin type 3 domain-containing protein